MTKGKRKREKVEIYKKGNLRRNLVKRYNFPQFVWYLGVRVGKTMKKKGEFLLLEK